MWFDSYGFFGVPVSLVQVVDSRQTINMQKFTSKIFGYKKKLNAQKVRLTK